MAIHSLWSLSCYQSSIMMNFTLSFLSYVLLYLAIGKSPDKFWDQIFEVYLSFLSNMAKRKKQLPIIGDISRGEDLLISLSECEAKIAIGLKIFAGILPRYKFYTDLLEQIFEHNRSLGIGIKKFIPEIRMALIRDLQFEKKIFDEIISACLQFLVIAMTTWSFVILSKSLVSIPLNTKTAFMMLGLELLGILFFFYLIRHLKTKTFSPFRNATEELYLFSAFLDIGLPVNEVLLRSKILQGSLATDKSFENLSSRVKKLVVRMKETGLSPKAEVSEIIRELWHLQEVHFGKFTKMVQVLKFSVLAFFFLPAYFLYLHSIFQFFMEQ